MRTLLPCLLFLICWSALGQNTMKEEIESTIGLVSAAKIIGFINHQHYGESGSSPQSEQQLLATCSSPDLKEIEEMAASKKKAVRNARNSSELLHLAESSSIEEFRSNYKTRQEEILENAIPRVVGYCDLKNAPDRCNMQDNNCPAVKGAYAEGLKKVLYNESTLKLNVRSLCQELVKAIAAGHKSAVSELEMCRLESDDIAAKDNSKNSAPAGFVTIEVGRQKKNHKILDTPSDFAPAKTPSHRPTSSASPQ